MLGRSGESGLYLSESAWPYWADAVEKPFRGAAIPLVAGALGQEIPFRRHSSNTISMIGGFVPNISIRQLTINNKLTAERTFSTVSVRSGHRAEDHPISLEDRAVVPHNVTATST